MKSKFREFFLVLFETPLNSLCLSSITNNFRYKNFNALTMTLPLFDYGCTSWYPLLSKTMKTKSQIAQNKWMSFCLEPSPRGHMSIPFRENKLASG